jgi:hypothetical protein
MALTAQIPATKAAKRRASGPPRSPRRWTPPASPAPSAVPPSSAFPANTAGLLGRPAVLACSDAPISQWM